MSFENNSEILMYQTEDGQTKIDVRMEDETVWLTQAQMAELFQTSKQNVSLHINNVFKEGELDEISVVKEYLTTAADGKKYKTKFYNLDVIISVGYRVKSHRGTQFRIWATQRLKEYIIKGFTMNDDLLKKAGGGNYFEELLERIRDIRSSEKVFYRKILDIYATSIDYSPDAAISQQFFQTVQNKMHWAAHGHTAAEIVYLRADSTKPFMGMTNFTGSKPSRSESQIAKNYLTEDELAVLNRIVNAYIEFAELQAMRRKPMYMADWIEKLDDFLKMSDNEILTHAGKISHQQAAQKAIAEYEKYRERTKNELSEVEKHFLESIEKTAKMLKGKKDSVGGDGE
ncbi:virulence RhuM family protein [Thermicanus aegyptius]|uniref:virulence RhuM family protein n=1 Tax=Thermicanus aegyptius TaxID=94009 RepID=UPI0003FD04EC|nr:virulence RhuM family protein [Thermicanus aegyptius]